VVFSFIILKQHIEMISGGVFKRVSGGIISAANTW